MMDGISRLTSCEFTGCYALTDPVTLNLLTLIYAGNLPLRVIYSTEN
jgi:hypothetical protein